MLTSLNEKLPALIGTSSDITDRNSSQASKTKGHFLPQKRKHTKKWYREEFLIPELSNRDFFESWERGHTDLQEKAKQKAAKILKKRGIKSRFGRGSGKGSVALKDAIPCELAT